MKVVLAVFVALIGAVLSGCSQSAPAIDPAQPIARRVHPTPTPIAGPVRFADATAQSGVRFHQNNAAFGLKLILETLGSGAAWLDYDGDGDQDIFLVNGRDWTEAEINAYRNGAGGRHAREHSFRIPPRPSHQSTFCALFRNEGNGTFRDITRDSGLQIEMQGMGAAVGDYDNDGRDDLFVTAYPRNYLFHNQSTAGRARFVEQSQLAGVRDSGWSTSAAWLDYDRDGRLDLFVGHYVAWTPNVDRWNSIDERHKNYSSPSQYKGVACRLFHNRGDGRFEDVSRRAGVQTATRFSGRISREFMTNPTLRVLPPLPPATPLLAKALGVAICDYDNDGWIDIAVANDTVPTFLFRNNHDGTFSDMAAKAGLTQVVKMGGADGGMGIDAGDIDHSGHDSIVIGFYHDQLMGLYRNQGQGLFSNVSGYAELGRAGTNFVTFGTVFLDIDNDGWLDLLSTNGHVLSDISVQRRDLSYRQRPLLFHNRRAEQQVKFEEVGRGSGPVMARPLVGRGLACADYDLDGDIDVLVTTNGGASVLMNNQGCGNRAIRLHLQGTRSNRNAIGAVVQSTFMSGGRRQSLRLMVKSGSSYLSQSELPLTVGIGRAATASLQIRWPSGAVTTLPKVLAGQAIWVSEDRGLLRQSTLRPSRKAGGAKSTR